MAWVQFDSYQEDLFEGNIAHDSDTIKIALIDSTLAPAAATHDFWDDLNTNEVTGTNYTAGGNAVASKTITTAANVTTFDAADPAAWAQSASGFADARYAIMYKDSGVASTSPLMFYHDFGSDQGNVAGELAIVLATAGIATIS